VLATAPSVLHLATELLAAHRYGAVVALCNSALYAGADDAPTRLLLSRALLALDRYSEARIQLSRCAAIAPDCPETYRLLARVAIRCHDHDAARLFHREANLLEKHSAVVSDEDSCEQLTTDTWYGTTLERQVSRSNTSEATVPRVWMPQRRNRERTRRERPPRIFPVGTELGGKSSFDMETTQEHGAFRA